MLDLAFVMMPGDDICVRYKSASFMIESRAIVKSIAKHEGEKVKVKINGRDLYGELHGKCVDLLN